jgi:hypothetical protein
VALEPVVSESSIQSLELQSGTPLVVEVLTSKREFEQVSMASAVWAEQKLWPKQTVPQTPVRVVVVARFQ